MPTLPISDPVGVLAVLAGVCALVYWLEKATAWRLFNYLPPLVFIYVVPAILTNVGVLPAESLLGDAFDKLVLPMMLVLLLLELDIMASVRVMGRGVVVMLFGTAGVVVGAPIGYALVKTWLPSDAWKAFGSLSGSWIGGTANLAAVARMIDASPDERALAVLGDTTIYLVWLPVLMAANSFSTPFARWSGVAGDRVAEMETAAAALPSARRRATHRHYLYLFAIASAAAWAAHAAAEPLAAATTALNLSAGTWQVLLVTTIGIALSLTPLRAIPGSRDLGMALVLLYMAHMGSTANLANLKDQALPFLAGAIVWILIHGAFCLLGARLMKVDVHTAAIASAANIGGCATASQVAAYHKESLVPVGILMALLGYALGNYAGLLAATLCRWAS